MTPPAKRSRRAKLNLRAELRFNAYEILSRAVETGLELGWNRAHKHTESPDGELIRERQFDAIMCEVSELLA